MSDRHFRSHASRPPRPESGRSGANEPTRAARSCSYRPPDPTPHRSAHDRQPTDPGSAPTSPPPPSPQPTETDHPPMAGRVAPPAHCRLPALDRYSSALAHPSLSRLGPLRLPLAGCPPSRLGRGSSHPRAESRQQHSPNHPRPRRALDHRDDARATPPRAAERLAPARHQHGLPLQRRRSRHIRRQRHPNPKKKRQPHHRPRPTPHPTSRVQQTHRRQQQQPIHRQQPQRRTHRIRSALQRELPLMNVRGIGRDSGYEESAQRPDPHVQVEALLPATLS